MSLLEKLFKAYGKNLPSKSVLRNDQKKPCTIEEIGEEFGSYDHLVMYAYPKFLANKAKPAAEVKTKPVTAPVQKKVTKDDNK